jgi:hypothetical protein
VGKWLDWTHTTHRRWIQSFHDSHLCDKTRRWFFGDSIQRKYMMFSISSRVTVLSRTCVPYRCSLVANLVAKMSSESVDDILEWFDQLQLLKRKQSFLKNVPASIADCVLVADIIHAVFPKIIQVLSDSILFLVPLD